MEKSSWEANSDLPNQEIPCFLWNQKVHRRVHNSLQLEPGYRLTTHEIR
jgi:hypothetical protein